MKKWRCPAECETEQYNTIQITQIGGSEYPQYLQYLQQKEQREWMEAKQIDGRDMWTDTPTHAESLIN